MDRVTEKRLSLTLARALDSLGYSDTCIRTRQALWKGVSETKGQCPSETYITAGSKAEGTSLLYESDIDMVASLNNLVCSDNVQEVDKGRYLAVFEMETANVAPGYARLRHTDFRVVERMARRDASMRFIFNSTVPYEGGYYLSSEIWIPQSKTRTGPAVTVERAHRVPLSQDIVVAIPCQHESMLRDWVRRPRRHGWPAPEVIRKIATLEGHAVPVGFKGSEHLHIEWRVCYTQAEVELVRNLNHTQCLLFVFLKKLAKKLLKPICSDVTSYVIKNTVFWTVELLSGERFIEENLLSVAMDTLKFFRETVRTRNLSNYIIAKRNLFAGKLEQTEHRRLCEILSTIIDKGPQYLIQCPEFERIRRRMVIVYKEPEVTLYEQKKREEVELDHYHHTVYGHVMAEGAPVVAPFLKLFIEQGMSIEMFEQLEQIVRLYLLNYFSE